MKTLIIHEVGLRDGLQMEQKTLPLSQKIAWASSLLESGVDIVQLGSFVHRDKVPQMADTDELFRHFNSSGRKPSSVVLSGLVLNEKGLERGLACGVDMFCMGVSASETHSRKNTGMTTKEAVERIVPMAQNALGQGKRIQVSVQSAFGCGFEGAIGLDKVLGIVRTYLDAGLRSISLADTAGHAHPRQVTEMMDAILRLDSSIDLTCHFHNTYGLGLANCYAAMASGVHSLESSVAGLGGCPFTKVAAGNVCTEDLVHSLQRTGQRSDINLAVLINLANDVSAVFGREMPGLVHRIGVLRGTGLNQ